MISVCSKGVVVSELSKHQGYKCCVTSNPNEALLCEEVSVSVVGCRTGEDSPTSAKISPRCGSGYLMQLLNVGDRRVQLKTVAVAALVPPRPIETALLNHTVKKLQVCAKAPKYPASDHRLVSDPDCCRLCAWEVGSTLHAWVSGSGLKTFFVTSARKGREVCRSWLALCAQVILYGPDDVPVSCSRTTQLGVCPTTLLNLEEYGLRIGEQIHEQNQRGQGWCDALPEISLRPRNCGTMWFGNRSQCVKTCSSMKVEFASTGHTDWN